VRCAADPSVTDLLAWQSNDYEQRVNDRKHSEYLIIGGGLAGASAIAGIREHDPICFGPSGAGCL